MYVDGTDLDDWARRTGSRYMFPELARRLVLATTPALEFIEFRAGEGADLGGWDGRTSQAQSHPLVPRGWTGWELSVRADSSTKASEDYDTRSEDPLGLTPLESTFVYGTPRRWAGKQAWANTQKAKGTWADVKAYDADDFATWLHLAPAVDIWLARLLEKQPPGVLDIEGRWQQWSDVTVSPLPPELLLADREQDADHVAQWLQGPASVLTLRAETEDEAIAFLAAVVLADGAAPDQRARCLAVRDPESWLQLAAFQSPLILVSELADSGSIGAATAQGHHVLHPIARNHPGDGQTLELAPPNPDSVHGILVFMGVDEEEASTLAVAAKRGLAPLRRTLAKSPASLLPPWARPPVSRLVVAAMLAGRWRDDSEADMAVLSRLAGTDYPSFRAEMRRLEDLPDSPVRRIGLGWFVTARRSSWQLVGGFLHRQLLHGFREDCIAVLGETNPKYDLPPEERFASAATGHVPSHSELLHEGFAQTLALLSILPETEDTDGQVFACEILDALLGDVDDWKLWASIGSQLPVLAEACPEGFMDILEAEMANDSPAVGFLFQHGDNRWFSDRPEAGLVVALERLAWAPNNLARASVILAQLAENSEA